MNADMTAYLSELKQNLHNLPDKERNETIEFYREYILDGNLTDRTLIEQKLGTAQQLARKIMADYSLNLPEATTTKIQRLPQDNMRLIWWIVLGILAMPVGIPVLLALIGILLGIVGLTLGLIVGFFGLVFGLTVGGLVAIASGLRAIWANWAVGTFYTGCGLMAISLGAIIVPLVLNFIHALWTQGLYWIRHLGKRVFKQSYYQTSKKESSDQ